MKKYIILIAMSFLTFVGCSKMHSNEDMSSKLYFHSLKNNLGYSQNDILYYIETNTDATKNIKCIDYNNKTVYTLCSNLQCLHNDSTCPSWFPYVGSEMACIPIGDKLLIFQSLAEKYIDKFGEDALSKIYISDLNGENKRLLVKLQPNQTTLGQFIFDDKDNIYSLMRETVLDEDEHFITTTYLVSINIPTGEIKKLHTFSGNSVQIIGVSDNTLLVTDAIIKNSGIENTLIKYDVFEQKILKTFPLKTNQNIYYVDEQIFIEDVSVASLTTLNASTFDESNKIFYTIKEEGKLYNIVELFDNKFIFYSYDIEQDKYEYYIYNLVTGVYAPFNLTMKTDTISNEKKVPHISVIDSYNDYYVVANTCEFKEVAYLRPDNTYMNLPKLYYNYAIIKKSDFVANRSVYESFEEI